ncbi:hypothetical protein ACLOJK_014158 [Asimina triloba]
MSCCNPFSRGIPKHPRDSLSLCRRSGASGLMACIRRNAGFIAIIYFPVSHVQQQGYVPVPRQR